MMNETIVALSSGTMKAAIAIIRLSGSQSFEILSAIFSNQKQYEHQKIYYGYIMDQQEVVDEVMVSCFLAPHSFTCENMVEINCHGNPYIIQHIIALCIQHGARLAERGEFTKRAFLNGRIDLVKAESINDLIMASNKQAVQLALSGLKGLTSKYVVDLSEQLLDVMGTIEVNIDYPEYDDVEELTASSLLPRSANLLTKMNKILDDSKNIKLVKEGIKTVIIGRPNVGKSSLLNALLREDKAIVTNIAGTTRDIVEGSISIDGVVLNMIDTAGIRETDDIIESMGVEKSKELIHQADLVLLVIDGSQSLSSEDMQLLELTEDATRIIVLNKADQGTKVDLDGIVISAKDNQISTLTEEIKKMFELGKIIDNNDHILTNARQTMLLQRASQALKQAVEAMEMMIPTDLIVTDLYECWNNLKEILGEKAKEDLLDELFKRFCIGK